MYYYYTYVSKIVFHCQKQKKSLYIHTYIMNKKSALKFKDVYSTVYLKIFHIFPGAWTRRKNCSST